MDKTWTLLLVLVTGEQHALPANPAICAAYAAQAAETQPSLDRDGARIYVRTAICGPTAALGLTPPKGWPDLVTPFEPKGSMK
jgi:hypothetical protein